MIRNRICLSTKIDHLFSENKQKQQACDDEVRKYEWMRKLSDVFKRPFIQKRWYAKPSIKIEEKIVRTGSLTYRQTPKAICWSPFYRVTLDNFDIMCSKNEHSHIFLRQTKWPLSFCQRAHSPDLQFQYGLNFNLEIHTGSVLLWSKGT